MVQNEEYLFQNICSFWQVLACHGQAKDCIALSLKQSKYYVLAEWCKERVWIQWLLTKMGLAKTKQLTIHCDKQNALEHAQQ